MIGKKNSRLLRASALPMGGAAVVHLVHSVAHLEDPLLLWFFAGAAAVQLGLAVAILRNLGAAPLVALGFNSLLIGLYAITRLPMIPSPEPVEVMGLAAKALELSAVGLIAYALAGRTASSPSGGPKGPSISRRKLLAAGSLGAVGAVAGGLLSGRAGAGGNPHRHQLAQEFEGAHFHLGNVAVGEVDTSRFDPTRYLKDFDYGTVSTLPDGRTLREYRLTSLDLEIEVAPGVEFPAWAYNSQVPGPTIRATEGDVVRIHFTNAGEHPHTIHFHGFHSAGMDGVFELVNKGRTFTYEFVAEPFGLHLYHCHTPPLKRHIHKGLYGTFIVDPRGGRTPANEMVMMMNGFDTNFDGDNEIYAVNTVAHYYLRHPIKIRRGELVRIYLVNITEFDLINSFHSHATFFNEYRTGTRMESDNFTDTIILGQGERSILEFTYREPGSYMFHAHVSEFAELGWTGMFEVLP